MAELRHRTAQLNGIRLHWAEAGAGRPLVLLHGFPDFWYTWRLQWPALARAGFRVIMPDLRGYGESERPRGVASYRTSHIVADVEALIDAECGGRAALAGHDWGGVIAWQLAARSPARVSRLAILNAPHPQAYRDGLRHAWQLRRSWYVFLFQLPGVAELALGAGNSAALERLLRHRSHARAVTEADVARYRALFAQPGALTAALNWYRAAARDLLSRRDPPPAEVRVPTLVLWGERDPALDVRLLDGLDDRVAELEVHRFPLAGHFVHWSEPEAVTAALERFLSVP